MIAEIARFIWMVLCFACGLAFETAGQGLMKCGVGCFQVGHKCLHHADQLVEYALYEDWD